VIENPHDSSQLPDDPAVDSPTVAPAIGGAAHGHESAAASNEATSNESSPQQPPADDLAPEAAESQEPVVEESIAEEPAADDSEAEAEVAEEEIAPRGAIEETPEDEESLHMDWYILKVQSNREESIRESLQRRVKVAGLERFFGEVIVPTEMVSEFKGGKKRVVKRKLYPGYLVAHMQINDETWFLVRETPGIGDFTGSAGKPTPMQPHEVSKIVAKQEEKSAEAPKLKINFNVGDRVKINEGTFENFEGEVDSIDEANGRVTVMINIFGRSTPVELEYWQTEVV
jgi:transcriptional antiterminator NusG